MEIWRGQLFRLYSADAASVQLHIPFCGFQQAHHHLHEGRFSSSVGSDEGDLFSPVQFQIKMFKYLSWLSLYRTVSCRYLFKGNHRFPRLFFLSFPRRFLGISLRRHKDFLSFFYCRGQRISGRISPLTAEFISRHGQLGREDIALPQLVHPAQSFPGRQHPADPSVLHEHHMFAVVSDIFRVVLDDQNRLSVLLIQFL